MDKRVINFTSKVAADKFANELHADRVAIAQANGYTVINNEIVGKNALTGEDMLSSQRTKSWTAVTDEFDGTFSILDESINEVFDSRLAKQGNSYTRKTITIPDSINE